MKAELFYITDAYCIWCYGFERVISQVANQYKETLNVRVVNGGMIPSDMPLFDMFSRFPDPMALHQHVATTSGNEFGEPYLQEIKQYRTSKRILNSTTPARAVFALRSLGVDDELAVANAIQHAYYADGNDMQDVVSYKAIATHFEISFAAFKERFEGPEVLKGAAKDRQFVEQLGIQGFPAVLLRTQDKEFSVIARGFMPFESVKANLDAALERYGSVAKFGK